MDDLISRQAAIDAVRKLDDYTCTQIGVALGDAMNAIAKLPSAQPEIIRCKDCKYYGEHWYCEAWNNSPGFPIVDVDGYCSLAERREDE